MSSLLYCLSLVTVALNSLQVVLAKDANSFYFHYPTLQDEFYLQTRKGDTVNVSWAMDWDIAWLTLFCGERPV